MGLLRYKYLKKTGCLALMPDKSFAKAYTRWLEKKINEEEKQSKKDIATLTYLVRLKYGNMDEMINDHLEELEKRYEL